MVQLRKAALLIALSYSAPSTLLPALNAPKYDVVRVANYLASQGYTDVKIINDEVNPLDATRLNILAAMNEFVQKTNTGLLDEAFFFYSGHGTQLPDASKDEMNEPTNPPENSVWQQGQDSVLVPEDVEYRPDGGPILDDEINNIFSDINSATHLTVVIDCCNSGTLMDFQYEYRLTPNKDFQVNKKQRKLNFFGICMSASADAQLSYESVTGIGLAENGGFAVSSPSLPGGFMTCALLETLASSPALRYDTFKLLDAVQERLADWTVQVPQVASTTVLDASTPFFRKP